MCKAKTPEYTPPPSYARSRKPDNAALYEEAQQRAAERGGGTSRGTVLTGLQGDTSTPVVTNRQRGQRSRTALG